MRKYRALANDAGLRVGEDAFKAISQRVPYLAFTRRDDQQRSIIFALLSDAPCTAKPIAIVSDIITLKIGQSGNDDLTSALVLNSLELGRQRLFLRRIENIGRIDHSAGERRECLDRKSTRLNSSHECAARMPSSA